jgi:CarD family transcriptional regulator
MAARKKSTNSGRSKSARTRSAPSAERQQRRKRPTAAKAVKKATAAAKSSARSAAATKKAKAVAKAAAKGRSAAATKKAQAAVKAASKAAAAKAKESKKAADAKAQAKKLAAAKARAAVKAPAAHKEKRPVAAAHAEPKVVKVEIAAHSAPKPAAPVAVAAAPVRAPAPPVVKHKPAAAEDALSKAAKPAGQRQGFKLNEFVVYPAHGVGQIVAIEEQEVAGFKLELFVISFIKDKMTLRVPTSKVSGVGMRKISDPDTARRSLDILSGRARIKRTMWSRRAQEYETKINSGDIGAIAEVVRDLYRSEAQPEQSYSERQLYEAALDRMVREIAAVHKSNEIDALKAIEAQLQKTHLRAAKAAAEASDREIEEAA